MKRLGRDASLFAAFNMFIFDRDDPLRFFFLFWIPPFFPGNGEPDTEVELRLISS